MSEDDAKTPRAGQRASNPAPHPAPHPERAGTPGEMDQRGASDRRKAERRLKAAAVSKERRSGTERRTGQTRRKRSMNQYDMDADVLEFVNAINQFKQRAGKAFPTWSEVLEILKQLGYEKQP